MLPAAELLRGLCDLQDPHVDIVVEILTDPEDLVRAVLQPLALQGSPHCVRMHLQPGVLPESAAPSIATASGGATLVMAYLTIHWHVLDHGHAFGHPLREWYLYC